MPNARPPYTDFCRRLRAREHLLGTFIKTPTTHATEILGGLGFDFVIIDQEHTPFDRSAIDVIVLAARATNIAAIVRVGDPSEANILSVLDCGASGIFVPHVDSAAKARRVAAACRPVRGRLVCRPHRRSGFTGGLCRDDRRPGRAGSGRRYRGGGGNRRLFHRTRRPHGGHRCSVGDLIGNPQDRRAHHGDGAQCRHAGRMLSPDRTGAIAMAKLGATAFIASSDQAFFKQAARQALKEFAPPIEDTP